MDDDIQEKPEMRMWRVGVWPIGAIHLMLTRSRLGASVTLGIYIWKLSFHASIGAMD
jgi:hypothetical protein